MMALDSSGLDPMGSTSLAVSLCYSFPTMTALSFVKGMSVIWSRAFFGWGKICNKVEMLVAGGAILCLGGVAYYLLSRKAKPKTGEKQPLLLGNKRQVSKAIAKFENSAVFVSQYKKQKVKASWFSWRTLAVTPVSQSKPVERCPACRAVITNSSKDVLSCQEIKIHARCFRCCDCYTELQGMPTVQQYASSTGSKFQCAACCQQYNGRKHTNKADVHYKVAGTRVTIGAHEMGDTKDTMEKIGDDLSEAVFFMHPKCCVCGGGFD